MSKAVKHSAHKYEVHSARDCQGLEKEASHKSWFNFTVTGLPTD